MDILSVVVLTHNDEKNIDKTLTQLTWCSEIIIVDDLSTDKTIQKAQKFTSKIYTHPLRNDFAAQRNFGLSKTSGDWILIIDSDEIVTNELKQEITSKLHERDIQGYFLKRKDFFMGQELTYGETSLVKLLRLARRSSGIWVRPVHETWENTGMVGELVNPILHYPHPTLTEFLSDVNRYSTLNAAYFYDQGERAGYLQILVYPVAKFIRNYIIFAGYRDHTAGAVLALMMSFHSFLTRAKLFMLHSP